MIELDGYHLTIEQVAAVARHNEAVGLSDTGITQIETSHQRLKKIIQTGDPVYGINTGFGIFSDRKIPKEDIATFYPGDGTVGYTENLLLPRSQAGKFHPEHR